MAESKSLRIAYGEALAELGAENDKIVVLDADLSNATMTNRFSAVYPDRFFDFGIAEANMACAAAGFAHEGLIPFISTFALFGAGRAYEQIRNSIAYVNANVKFGFSHSGLCVGEDGGSHQSIEDIALMRVMPNMTIFVPCDAVEVRKAVRAAAAIEGPVYIRVARPVCECFTDESTPFVPGKANIMREGGDVAIIAMGLIAFAFATVGGVLFGKVLYLVTGGKINPLIGSAGVSAVPMAARVAQNVGGRGAGGQVRRQIRARGHRGPVRPVRHARGAVCRLRPDSGEHCRKRPPPGEVSAKKQVDFVSVYSAFSLDSYKKITVCHSFPQNP